MRVALLSYNAQAGDAIGNAVAEKLGFFLDRGADVRVFVESDQQLHPNIRPHGQRLDPRETRGEGWAFLNAADLVIAEYGQAYALLQLLPLLARPRILVNYHGVTPSVLWGNARPEAVAEGARQRGLVWCADGAIVHSRFTRRELLDATDFPPERIFPLGHVVPAETFSPGPPERDLRERLGLKDANLLLFVGRLAPNKRTPLIVDALVKLRERVPPVHAVLVGDDSACYQDEARRCRERATERGVSDRLHILGRLSEEQLRDAYRSADLFVMPSLHEGFCVPVVEAMACGLPVLAARAGALPETVADAGRTFEADDAEDFARQIGVVLDAKTEPAPTDDRPSSRVAVVSYRYGGRFAGGAERSLQTIAESLHKAGHHVEVFTTCAASESHEASATPEGTTTVHGIAVHRFRLNPGDPALQAEAVREVLQARGTIPSRVEEAYLENALHSDRLLEVLRQRAAEFDAILVGPYLIGLTHAVARAFPAKTILLPCFHDEPLARLRAWREVYANVGGILYHTQEEQDLAERKLGINHPGAAVCGTWIDTEPQGDADRGRRLVGTGRPYVVYCGRYSPQKGLPALIDCARAYAREHPDRFTFVFMGEGGVAIPREPWARDLGYVNESVKRDVLAGAAALVQLSKLESLSLVALEAWAQGTPVIAHAQCPALVGHLQRGGGGRAVDGTEALTAALDDLWEAPESWVDLRANGREYVRSRYGNQQALVDTIVHALHDARRPLVERLRERGLQRAASFDRPAWRQRFAAVVEQVLDVPPRPYRYHVEVVSRARERKVAAGLEHVLIPVQVVNRGTHAILNQGPGRVVLRAEVTDEAGKTCLLESSPVPLPGMLMPGHSLAAAVPVRLPSAAGAYQVTFRAECLQARPAMIDEAAKSGVGSKPATVQWRRQQAAPSNPLRLVVEGGAAASAEALCRPMLDAAQSALVEAQRLGRLPDDYRDVSRGTLAWLKGWVKRKLLGNFQRAYVDVLSRQQSAFNDRVVAALHEVVESYATLQHARSLEGGADRKPTPDKEDLTAQVRRLTCLLAESKRTCAILEERLARLEAIVQVKNPTVRARA